MSDDFDDDDWGDIGISDLPTKLVLPGQKATTNNNKKPQDNPLSRIQSSDALKFFQDEEEEEDFSNDFKDSNLENLIPKPLKITGIKADPNAKEEDWDADFDIEPGQLRIVEAPKKFQLVTGSTSNNALAASLRDLLSKLPTVPFDEDEDWDDMLDDQPSTTDDKDKEDGAWESIATEKTDVRVAKAKAMKDKWEESRAIMELGVIYFNKKDYLKAMIQFKQANSLLQEAKLNDSGKSDIKYESELFYYLGDASLALSDIFQATEYFRQSQDIIYSDKLYMERNLLQLSKLSFKLGMCALSKEQWGNAGLSFVESLQFLIKISIDKMDWDLLGKISFNISKSTKHIQLEDIARSFASKSLDYTKKANDNETYSAAEILYGSFPKTATPPPVVKAPEPKKDEEEESDFEDWDKELELDTTQRAKLSLGADAVGPAVVADVKKELIPPKYKILEAARNDVEIIGYPKASTFFSLDTKVYKPFKEEELEGWLKDIIVKNQGPVRAKTLEMSAQTLRQNFIQSIPSVPKFTVEWAKMHLQLCAELYYIKAGETCWNTLEEYFLDCKDMPRKQEKDLDDFIHITVQILYYAIKFWKKEEDSSFKEMLTSMKKLDPRSAEYIRIIEAEKRILYEKDEAVDDTLKELAKIYDSIKDRPESTHSNANFSEFDKNFLMARILCDIHLIMNDIDPLTTEQRQSLLEEEQEEEPEIKRTNSRSPSTEVGFYYNSKLYEPTSRMNLLFDVYKKLPVSFLKAKVAYALGHHATFGMDDLSLAEKLYFESLYIMDTLHKSNSDVPPLISELGTNILMRYSEVLLTNLKYPFAIAGFDSAVMLYKLRNRSGFFPLMRRLAAIAQDNEDTRRAREFYIKVWEGYSQLPDRLNETRHVSEVLSTLYLEDGDFRRAEVLLDFALKTLPNQAQTEKKIDPVRFKIYMKLVDLHLISYRYEKAIELLEMLRACQLPHNSRTNVLTKFVEAYMKKRWFKEAGEILKEINQLGHENKSNKNNNLKLWELYASLYYHSHSFQQSLYCIDVAITMCPTSNLSQLARYFLLRGKVLQALSCSATALRFPTSLKPSGTFARPEEASITMPTHLFTSAGDLIQECVSSYDKAYYYFRVIGDDINIAKTTTRISETYLERLFAPVALLNYPYNELSRFPFFEVSLIAKQDKQKKAQQDTKEPKSPQPEAPKEFVISFERIENPTICSMDICAQTYLPLLMVKNYLNMVELRYVQGDTDAAKQFWIEAKDVLTTMFLDGSQLLGKSTPSHFLKKLLKLVKRMSRFLFCMDSEFINKNLTIVDSMISLEYELDQSYKRKVVISNDIKQDDSSSDLKSSKYENRVKRSGTEAFIPSEVSLPDIGSPRVSVSTIFQADAWEHKTSDSSKLSELAEDAAFYTWGFLYAIRCQVGKFIKGKLSNQEVKSRNRSHIRRILNIRQNYDVYKQNLNNVEITHARRKLAHRPSSANLLQLQHFKEFNSSNDELSAAMQQKDRAQAVVFALKLDDYIIYYVPGSGQRRFLRMGGKEEITNTPNVHHLLHLKLHLLRNAEEFVSLIVSPSLTLDGLLKYLCNKPYWEVEDQAKKSSASASLLRKEPGKGQPLALKHKPKFMDRTKNFHSELLSLLELLGYKSPLTQIDPPAGVTKPATSKGISTAQLSLISFAKRNAIDDYTFIYKRLNCASNTSVAQCFTQKEMDESSALNPLDLYLYLSTSNLSDLSSKLAQMNKNATISEEILTYLTSLIIKELAPEIETSKKILSEMADSIVSSLEDIMPNISAAKTYSSSISYVSLICSKSMHIIPWEILLTEQVLRCFTLSDLTAKKKPSTKDDLMIPLPKYFSFLNNDRSIMSIEDSKRSWLVEESFTSLNLRTHSMGYLRGSSVTLPFHTPLVKYGKRSTAYRRKYKHINWFDLTLIMDRPESDICQIVERDVANAGFPVFVLSYTDLLDMSTVLFQLMRKHPEYGFLFVPANNIKAVTAQLMKIHDEHLKPAKKGQQSTLHLSQSTSRFNFLMKAVRRLQTEFTVPIATFINPTQTNNLGTLSVF